MPALGLWKTLKSGWHSAGVREPFTPSPNLSFIVSIRNRVGFCYDLGPCVNLQPTVTFIDVCDKDKSAVTHPLSELLLTLLSSPGARQNIDLHLPTYLASPCYKGTPCEAVTSVQSDRYLREDRSLIFLPTYCK